MFMLEFSNIVERIRGNQSKVIKATNLRERELEQTGYQAFTHIAHFAIWGTPLPRPYPQLTKAQRASNWMELTKIFGSSWPMNSRILDLVTFPEFRIIILDRPPIQVLHLTKGQTH